MNEQFRPAPSDNLVWAIICTVFCCLPLGIVAIVKASKVDSLWAQGREAEAIKAANDAKKYSLIGIIGSAVIWVIYMLVYLSVGLVYFGSILSFF